MENSKILLIFLSKNILCILNVHFGISDESKTFSVYPMALEVELRDLSHNTNHIF